MLGLLARSFYGVPWPEPKGRGEVNARILQEQALLRRGAIDGSGITSYGVRLLENYRKVKSEMPALR